MLLLTRHYIRWLFCAVAHLPLVVSAQPSVAFLSDTQSPMWVEKLVLSSNRNVEATGLVFQDIIRQRPNSLFILGDVVSIGYKSKKWSRMDRYLDSCRNAGIKVSAVLGNHDVMTRPRKGEAQFQKRFPDHNRTGFYQVVDSIAIIFLNSNFSKLSPPDLEAQQQWYVNTLKILDRDPVVKITIVACHHSPFSNSKIVGSSKHVQKYFVPGFLASSKSRLFISGHSHNYEQFKSEGKDFLVIGGGGGLRQPLSTKEDKFNDVSPEYKPQFHYIVMKRAPAGITLTSRYLKPDFSGFAEGYQFTVAYP